MTTRPGISAGNPQGGFTLIEVITALALGGLLLAVAGFGLIATVQGYFLAAENAAMSQKAQLAMTRLTNEYLTCYDCEPTVDPDNDPTTLTNVLGSRTLILNGTNLTINGDTLIDQVNSFTVQYEADNRITITMILNHAQAGSQITFSTRVLPRNTYKYRGPS